MTCDEKVIVHKDPNAVKDYGWNWTKWLDGDTIQSSLWLVAPIGLTSFDATWDTTSTTVWLSGGTVGATYEATNRVVTVGGRTEDWTFWVVIRPQ